MFATDTDLLPWEPNIFRDASAAAQTLLVGTGDLAGTSFTLDTGSLASAHIQPNHVIVLSNAFSGTFPIISIQSATQLTLSVLYDGLYPPGGDPVPSPAGHALNCEFAIRTFYPQRKVISDLIARSAGLDPLDESSVVLNAGALVRPTVLGTLHLIYSALAAASAEPEPLSVRADLYERLYRRALRNTRVDIDTNGDGCPEITRNLGVVSLSRT